MYICRCICICICIYIYINPSARNGISPIRKGIFHHLGIYGPRWDYFYQLIQVKQKNQDVTENDGETMVDDFSDKPWMSKFTLI